MKRRTLIQTAAITSMVGLPAISFAQRAEPFKIGALLPMSGGGAAFGAGMQRAIQLATEEVNAAGGAAGRMLEVTYEDDQTRPAFCMSIGCSNHQKKVQEISQSDTGFETFLNKWRRNTV